jgi:tetratricopeptide (TPR) repeat protein
MRLSAMLLAAGCSARVPPTPPDPLEVQRERASLPGREQSLELCRLATMELAAGNADRAEGALRQAVPRMMSVTADGEFAALLGAEDRKEWKGEPYEKMAAYHLLGSLLLASGDTDNALAMGKSAVLADTGFRWEGFSSDFAAGLLLQALAFAAEGEASNADAALERAVDAVWQRTLVPLLSDALLAFEVEGNDGETAAARALLLAGLSAGVSSSPRDPAEAVRGALSRATDLRAALLDPGPPPPGTEGIATGAARRALDGMGRLGQRWTEAAEALPPEALQPARATERALRDALGGRKLVVWVAAGRGPRKAQQGRYGEQLVIVPGRPVRPALELDGTPMDVVLVDDMGWQATTRGARRVDAFNRGKAVFKDTATALGIGLVVAGDVLADTARTQGDSTAGGVLQLVGAVLWIAGAVANPQADVRAWEGVPGGLWLAVADPPPGPHRIEARGRAWDVDVPERGTAFALVPLGPQEEP